MCGVLKRQCQLITVRSMTITHVHGIMSIIVGFRLQDLRGCHNLQSRSVGAVYLPSGIPMLIENESLVILFECFCTDRDVAVRPLQMWSSRQTWLGDGVCSNHFSRPATRLLESSVCPRIQLFADQFLYNLERRATRELETKYVGLDIRKPHILRSFWLK